MTKQQKMSWRLKIYYLTLYISLILCLSVELFPMFANAQGTAKKKTRKKRDKRFFTRGNESLRIAKILVVLCFAPPILTFIYYVVRDPVTPHLIMEIWYRLRESTTTYLGRGSNVMARKLYKEN